MKNRFDYHKPNRAQLSLMESMRAGVKHLNNMLENALARNATGLSNEGHGYAKYHLQSFLMCANFAIVHSLAGERPEVNETPQRNADTLDQKYAGRAEPTFGTLGEVRDYVQKEAQEIWRATGMNAETGAALEKLVATMTDGMRRLR